MIEFLHFDIPNHFTPRNFVVIAIYFFSACCILDNHKSFCDNLVILGADLVDDFVNFWSLPYSSDPSETSSEYETVSLI